MLLEQGLPLNSTAAKRIRYCIPTADANRARWPTRAGVLPSDLIHANRIA